MKLSIVCALLGVLNPKIEKNFVKRAKFSFQGTGLPAKNRACDT